MMMMVGSLVFTTALVCSVAVIWTMVAPQWRRIARLATGRIEEPFTPLAALVHAERRIAVRRWAGSPFTVPAARLREAA